MLRKKYALLTWILAIAINGLIGLSVFMPKIESLQAYDFSFLPLLNAVLNGLTFIALLAALIFIKQKNVRLHQRFIYLAFTATALFLVSYLLYHFSTPSVRYGGTGILKAVYLFILLTHIVLAALIVPLAMITMGRGLNNNIVLHRKIARWTMPIWLYVSLTGVLVYLMISPFYVH